MPERCRICARAEPAAFLEGASDYLSGDPFRIVRCPACGAGFTDPIPADLGRYYPERYRAYGGITAAFLRLAYRRRVLGWTRDFAEPGRALEIGCGPGVMLDALRRLGWTVKGIERSTGASRYARETLGLDVTADGIETFPTEPAFDLIVMFQVLEHLPDPLAVLRECAKRLKPGGRLVVSVPNLGSWQACFGGARWVHLDPPRHLVHFTRGSLRRALESCGFHVERELCPCFDLDVFGWVQSAGNRLLGDYNGLTRWLMGLGPFGGKVALSVVLGAAVAPFGAALSLAGRLFGRGAFLEAVAAVKPAA